MLNYWSDHNQRVYLPTLFDYLNYKLLATDKKYVVYGKSGFYYVVIKTDKGFLYYNTQQPELKLQASDLVEEYVAKIEGREVKGLWGKLHNKFNEYLDKECDLLLNTEEIALEIVDTNFNHFLLLNIPFSSQANANNSKEVDKLYKGLEDDPIIKGRLFLTKQGEVKFPLFNSGNKICGYLVDGKQLNKDEFTTVKNSIWFSNIPKKIERIVVFKDPKEAISFYKTFNLDDSLYLAIPDINYETTKILMKIKEIAKAKKLIISFTGSKDIDGYLRDLQFISFLTQDNFNVSILHNYISVVFKKGEEKTFIRYFNKLKEFNAGVSNDFIEYNKFPNQQKINRSIIGLSSEKDMVKLRIPIEVNAIKFSVWNYFKHYLKEGLEILKPKKHSWVNEFNTKSTANEGNTFEEYKIAQ